MVRGESGKEFEMFHGPHGPWMHQGRRARFFERGALKYLIIDIISEKPRHGYDIIREIEERTGGYYSPSPGTVYPTLQMLEDIGHLRIKEENGKKVYEITDEGKAYLKEHKERVKKHRERMSECCPPGSEERVNLMFELRKVFYTIAETARRNFPDADQIKEIKKVLEKAKNDVENIMKTKSA